MPLVQIGLLLLAQAATPPNPAPAPAEPLIATACRPDGDPDDIMVCGRRNQGGGYRLPAPDRFDPAGPIDSVSRERHRLLDVGAVGIDSCSPVGPGGFTGCELNDWRHADEQYAGRNHSILPRASVHIGVVGRALPPQ
jgi:hypothetical protein